MRRRPLCLLCLFVTVLFAVLYAAGLPLAPPLPHEDAVRALVESGQAVTAYGLITEENSREDYTTLILREAFIVLPPEDLTHPSRGKSRKTDVLRLSRLRITVSEPVSLHPGMWAGAAGSLTLPDTAENPGQFDQRMQLLAGGIRYQMKHALAFALSEPPDPVLSVLSLIRGKLLLRIRATFPSDTSGIVSALILGDKTMLDDDTRSMWQSGGIMHMLAISGLHITALGMALWHLACRVMIQIALHMPSVPRFSRPAERPFLKYRPFRPDAVRLAASCVSVCFMLFYCLLTGGSVSSVRAFLMFALLIGAKLSGRTYDQLTACACAALLLLLENPYYIVSGGFRMSFAAVLVCGIFRRRSRIFISLMLYLYMLPLVLMNTFEMPLYSFPVNLLAVPLLPLLLFSSLAGLAAGFILPPAIAGFPASAVIRLLSRMLSFVHGLPYSSVILGKPSVPAVIVYYILLSLWASLYTSRRLTARRFALLLLLPLLVSLPAHICRPRCLRATFFSVGQGDACLCETPQGPAFLSDGGSTSVAGAGTRRILPGIESLGVRRLEYIFASHMDEDHISGIREILEAIRDGRTPLTAGTLVLPFLAERNDAYRELSALAREAGLRILSAREGDSFRLGQTVLTVMNPVPSLETSPPDSNAQCLVLSVSYKSFDMLLTGDVYGSGEEHLTDLLEESPKRYEVLKVAHHGSRHSTPDRFLSAVRPAVSIISCGRGNLYGHPHGELLKRLGMAGTEVFRTDMNGAVTVESDGTSYTVTPYSPSEGAA